jgi:hypothetical protein
MSYEYAEHAIAQGYKIIPINPANKTPYLSAGFQYSNDPEVVATWWNVDFPDAVVGIGLVDSGIAIVDIDNHEGKTNGFDTVKKLGLPTETTYKYPSLSGKGEHHWYTNPGETKSGKLDGIDIKVTGYVITNYFVPTLEELYIPLPDEYRSYKSRIEEGVAWDGTISEWLDLYGGMQPSYEVTALVDDLRTTGFTGNEYLFKKMVRLVHLANDGKGGVPEAMRELYSIWKATPHSSGNPEAEFLRAMHRAILMIGGGKVELTSEQVEDQRSEQLNADADALLYKWEVADLAKRKQAQKYAIGTRQYTWEELEAMKVDWIIDGVLAFNNYSMLVGAPNIGKTFLYIDWMCASIAGRQWAGRETTKAKFMVVIGEGMTGWSDRVKAWCSENMEDFDEIKKSIIPMSQASLASDADIDVMAEIIKKENIDMVILDTWNTSSGLQDENSNGEASLSLNAMTRFQTGVLVVHHPNAETQNSDCLKARGATAVQGKMDFVVTMYQAKKDKDFDGADSKYIAVSTLDKNGGKSRHSERFALAGLWLKDVANTKVMVHDNGSITTSANLFFATALKDGPKSLKELVEWAEDNWSNGSEKSINRWAKLADPQRLTISKGEKNRNMYSWNDGLTWTPHN